MNKCKITVLKKTFDAELVREYGAEGLSACPMLREGQEFLADYACPQGFCDEAWKAIYQYVFAIAHGAGFRWKSFLLRGLDSQAGHRDLQLQRRTAPVIFKIERTDQEAEIDYEPVK